MLVPERQWRAWPAKGDPRCALLIDEPELGKVRLGAEAILTADAYPDESWACRVDLLPTEVIEQGARRVGEARCTVDSAASEQKVARLIPNLTVDVRLPVDRAENVVSLPREAIGRDEGGDFVWMADGGAARRRAVEVGMRGDERVEIASGLASGDRVIVPGAETLTDGVRVIVEE